MTIRTVSSNETSKETLKHKFDGLHYVTHWYITTGFFGYNTVAAAAAATVSPALYQFPTCPQSHRSSQQALGTHKNY